MLAAQGKDRRYAVTTEEEIRSGKRWSKAWKGRGGKGKKCNVGTVGNSGSVSK